jgi:heat shock 70kDa protein 1/2/6/8
VVVKISKEAGDSPLSVAFLEKLVAHFIEEFRTQHNKDLSSDESALQRLRIACESIRDTPWFAARTIEFDNFFEGIDFQITFTSSDYKKMWNSCKKSKPIPPPDVGPTLRLWSMTIILKSRSQTS